MTEVKSSCLEAITTSSGLNYRVDQIEYSITSGLPLVDISVRAACNPSGAAGVVMGPANSEDAYLYTETLKDLGLVSFKLSIANKTSKYSPQWVGKVFSYF